ncbi:MAG: DUF192 domain-containing protein [Thaumarchaeota archaeon]|nr:DUF192 domain-containing protein [Nitrososphaerota archaeon]
MNRVRLLIMAAVAIPLLIVAANIVLVDSTPIASSNDIHYSSFKIGDRAFALTYLATNQSALQKGLMNTKVNDDTTELFVFPNSAYYSFWMFDVNSSLDMMWIVADSGSNVGKVVYLELNAPPCHVIVACTSYHPTSRADLVLEAKGGFAQTNGVKVGTTVVFS